MSALQMRIFLCLAMAGGFLAIGYGAGQPKDIAIPADSVCNGLVWYA